MFKKPMYVIDKEGYRDAFRLDTIAGRKRLMQKHGFDTLNRALAGVKVLAATTSRPFWSSLWFRFKRTFWVAES